MNETPKAVLDAIIPERIAVCGLELRPLSLAHWLALQKIGSPIVQPDIVETTALDVVRAAMLLSMDGVEAMRLSRDANTLDMASAAFAAGIAPAVLPDLARAIRMRIDQALSAAIPGDREGSDSPLAGSAGS